MKKIISLLMAAAMVFSFAACGTKNESSEPQSSASSVSSTPEKLDTACNVFALNGPTGIGLAPLMKKAEDKTGRLNYTISTVGSNERSLPSSQTANGHCANSHKPRLHPLQKDR